MSAERNKAPTPHNRAKFGDYAPSVLLPGDPLRAKWIAENYLDDVKLVNDVRGCYGYTGLFDNRPVSVQATGMGQPSAAIYVEELLSTYGVKNLIRVGTCGGLSTKVGVRDLVIGMGACTDSSIVTNRFGGFSYAPIADYELMASLIEYAGELSSVPYHVGNILSSDTFYQEGGFEGYRKLSDHGVLGVEMEAATIYTLAAKYGARAVSICTMTDCLITGEAIPSSERETSLVDMVKIALYTAVTA